MALSQLEYSDAADCLLIDDDKRWVLAFEELGGEAKLFQGDEDFRDWLGRAA